MRRPSPPRRLPRAGAPTRHRPPAGRFGSIRTATCTTAPVRGGTARPRRAPTCPRCRPRRREPSRTTEKPALRNGGAALTQRHTVSTASHPVSLFRIMQILVALVVIWVLRILLSLLFHAVKWMLILAIFATLAVVGF